MRKGCRKEQEIAFYGGGMYQGGDGIVLDICLRLSYDKDHGKKIY